MVSMEGQDPLDEDNVAHSPTSSVDSDHPDAGQADVGGIILELIKLERLRHSAESKLEIFRERLRVTQDWVNLSAVKLKHIRRQQGSRARAVEKIQAKSTGHKDRKQLLLKEASAVETHLASINEERLQLESRLFRAASAFIRVSQREDPDEENTSRELRYQLRVLADFARLPKNGKAREHDTITDAIAVRDVEGSQDQFRLCHTLEARITEQNIRARCKALYDLVEPMFVDDGQLSPRIALVEDNSPQKAKHSADPEAPALLQHLASAQKEVYEAEDSLAIELRQSYEFDKEKFIATYEYPPQALNDMQSDAGPTMSEAFDIEFRNNITKAAERIRQAQAKVKELLNQCLEAKVAPPGGYAQFGVLDDANDGNYGCMEPSQIVAQQA